MSDRTGTPDPGIRLWLEAPGLDPETVQIAEMRLDAAISKPTEIDLDLVTEDPFGLDYQAILGQPATLHVSWAGDLQQQRHGVIADVEDTLEPQAGVYRHRVRLMPRLWRLSLRSRLAVHVDVSVPEAIRRTLAKAGFIEDLDFEMRLGTPYPARDFIIQYRESDLDFLRRLTEHWGISFFFESRDGRDVVVFADANIFWRRGSVTDTIEIDTGGLKKELYDVRGISTLVPKRYVLRDYNYHYPKVGLQSVIELERGVEGETVEYGANFRDEREAEILTRARRDEILAHAALYRGKCAEPVLAVGSLFRLTGNTAYEGERFLVVEQKARYTQTTAMSDAGERPTYTASCVAADAAIDFRPRRATSKPRIDGVLHGIIEPQAPPDSDTEKRRYGEVDAQGCYRVRLLVDDPQEGRPYPVVRLAQPSGGQGYGFHFPLRPGTEVMLSFIEGDPDRPIITGTAPNPSDRTPVAAENRSRNVIRTESGNQIDFDDTEDGARIKLETPFKGTALQLGAPNGPEEGVWMQSNGSIQAVSSITYGVTSLMQSSWSMFDFGEGLIRQDKAMKPKLGRLANAVNYLSWGAELAAAGYAVAMAVRDQALGWAETIQQDNDEKVARDRAQIVEAEAAQPDGKVRPTLFGAYLATMQAYCETRGRSGLYTRVTGGTYLAIVSKDPAERTASEIAYKEKVEAECAADPDASLLRFHMALVAFQQASEAYRAACAARNEAIAAGVAGTEHRKQAEAEMKAAGLPGATKAAKESAAALREAIAEECDGTAHADAGRAARKAVRALARTCAAYADALAEQCRARGDLASAKAVSDPATHAEAGALAGLDAAGATEQDLRWAGQIGSSTLFLLSDAYALHNKWKTARQAWRLWSDVKKVNSAAQLTGDWACLNAAHMQAWLTLKGKGPPAPKVGPRAFLARHGGLGAKVGDHLSPTGLFGLGDAVNMIGSEKTTDVGAGERLFLHGPVAVLAGMTAPAWNADTARPDVAGALAAGGTAAVLGMDLAMVASKTVTEIRSEATVLATGNKVDVEAADSVEITVTAAGAPHRLRIDAAGVTLDLGDTGKAVTVNAPKSAVSVTANEAKVQATEFIHLDSKRLVLKGEDIELRGKTVWLNASEVVALDGPGAKVELTAGGMDVKKG